MNRGEWPPNDEGALRIAEAKKACVILGANPLYAGQVNSQAIVDAAHYEAFRKIIEAQNPDALFTHWPIDNHADHRAISMLAYDAWLKLKKKFAFYYYEVSNGEDTIQFAPTHYVDVTKTEPRKRQACYAHASQSPDRYYSLQEQITRLRGIESGHRHAEGFIRHVQSPDFELAAGVMVLERGTRLRRFRDVCRRWRTTDILSLSVVSCKSLLPPSVFSR